jgi:putative sterol carrier protein
VATQRHPFLSDAWISAARKIRDKHLAAANDAMTEAAKDTPTSIRMNQIITEVPFGDGVIDAHIDTASGSLSLDLGHIADPDVTITVDYETAQRLFVDQDMSMAMQAFLSGKIRVDGDLGKLFALQSIGVQNIPGGAIERAQNVAAELKAITAE